MLDISRKYVHNPPAFASRPGEQWERAHDLQVDLPFVAVGEIADEDPLIGFDPFDVFVCELLEEIDSSHRHEPIVVLREGHQFRHTRRVRAYQTACSI